MTQWAYTPSFNYTVSTTLAIYCTVTSTVGPYFLIYDTVGLYPLIYLQSKYHPRHILYIYCPASVPPLFAEWAHASSFCYTVCTTQAIYWTQTVQPQFLPYLHSGPIPPHSMTQWAYTPFTYPVGTTLAIYCTQTV